MATFKEHMQQENEKQRQKNKEDWEKFHKFWGGLNSLEKIITVVVSTTLLFSASYGLHCLSEMSDADALQQSLQIQSQQIKSEMFANPYSGN